ncbi:hypothetical protein BJ741DRAFT_565676, partial [Chytriomyces cf. hyalinus JEL632]
MPVNTQLAYNRKGAEFLAYCREIFAEQAIPITVTEEKLFGFLYYQAHRPQCKRGKKPGGSAVVFNRDEFNSVMHASESSQQSHAPESGQQSVENTITKKAAYEMLNQYYCSILKIWQGQVDMNANNLSKEQLRSQRVKMLLGSVQKRKKREAAANFEEKLDAEFVPYLLVNKIPRIEEELFRRSFHSSKRCLGALRDRFCFLMSNRGILRGKSLFKCELSDLCDLVKEDKGVHDCHILVMRIAVGKTNGLKTLYGHVMRHKNVNLCP